MDANIKAANELAHQIAMAEIVRVILSRMTFDPDRETSRRNLKELEEVIVQSLSERKLWTSSEANAETEAYVREAASGYVSRIFSSIRHPSD